MKSFSKVGNSSTAQMIILGAFVYLVGNILEAMTGGASFNEALSQIEWPYLLGLFGLYPVKQMAADLGREKARIEAQSKLDLVQANGDTELDK